MSELNWPPGMRDRESVAPAGRPMPHAAVYQGWLGATVKELAVTTEADPVAILATLIGAYSVMIGSGPRIAILDNRAPLLVWPLILGRTSVGRKGMSYNLVKRLVREADSGFYSECVTSGLSSGEGLIDAVVDEDDEDQGPPPGGKQMLVVETEYANTMNRAGRDGNTLSGVLRQAWDGDSLHVLTRSRRKATHPHIGILAHITPGEFRMKVKSADMAGGSYNRFLPIFSERLQEIPLGEGADAARVAGMARELADLVKAARDVRKVGLTPAASDYWRGVIYSVLSASPAHDGTVAQFTARATEYCRRLAAVYALADGKVIVDREHLEAAYQLVNYSRATAAHVMGDGTGDPVLDKVITALMNAGEDGLKRSDITQRVLGGRKRPEIIADLFDKLGATPYVLCEQRSGKGRTAEVWVYCTEEAEQAEEARPPARMNSAPGAEEVRGKVGGDDEVDFLRTSSAMGTELEDAAHRAFPASSASSAPQGADEDERIEV